MTSGRIFKKLKKVYKLKFATVNIYNFTPTNKVILPTYLDLSDTFNKIYTSPLQYTTKSYYMYTFLKSSLVVIWARIIFRGKGYRIRNFQNELKLTFNFGHSHWTKIKFLKYWYFWKIKRQSYIIVTYSIGYFKQLKAFFPSIKLFNRYTQRGLRFKRQFIIKRFGKISQYISSLH